LVACQFRQDAIGVVLFRCYGLSEDEARKIEKELMGLLPKEQWIPFFHRLILHGCKARHAKKPRCGICEFNDLCPAAEL